MTGGDIPGLKLRGGHIAPAASRAWLTTHLPLQQRIRLHQALLELRDSASVTVSPWHRGTLGQGQAHLGRCRVTEVEQSGTEETAQ